MATTPEEASPLRTLLGDLFAKHGVTPYQCAKDLKINHPQLYEVMQGKRALSELLALKLGTYFHVKPERLLAIQTAETLRKLRDQHREDLARIRRVTAGR